MRIAATFLLFLFQTSSAPSPQLTETLSALTNAELAAWQHHDQTAYLANRDPQFMYVGTLGIIEPGHPVDNLMRCDVKSYSLAHVQTLSSSADTAILIAKQHQDATCFGAKQPAVLNITETYIRHNGAWKLLLRTEVPSVRIGPSKG